MVSHFKNSYGLNILFLFLPGLGLHYVKWHTFTFQPKPCSAAESSCYVLISVRFLKNLSVRVTQTLKVSGQQFPTYADLVVSA